MENWKYFAIFIVLVLVLSFTPCIASKKPCWWVLDAVKKENPSKPTFFIIPGGQYLLRIRVKCDDRIDSKMVRSLIMTGVNPIVSIEMEPFGLSEHKSRRFSLLISSLLVEMGDQEACGCYFINKTITNDRLTLHLDGFSYLVNNTRLGNRLGEEAQLPSIFHSVPINCVPNLSPNCVVGSLEMSNHVIFTSSEFEKMMFLKIQFGNTVKNRCAMRQSEALVEVKGALSLPDRVLINTGAGILELQANHSKIPAYVTSAENYSLVLDGCVSKMVGPVQSSIHTVTVLSLGDEQDKEKVFMAVLEKGKPANFTEQRDSSGKNVCQFLINLLDNAASYSCQVISGSISGVKTGSFVVLVMLETASTETFRVLPFEGSSMEWKALFHFPTLLQSLETESPNWQRIESNFTAEGSEVASLLSLTDISFTPVACESLFIWGNVLFFSPDGGTSIHWLKSFSGNSNITVFTSSMLDGTFAFLTDSQEVWVGQVGSPNVQRLHSSVRIKGLAPDLFGHNNSFIVSIFFDSSGRLQQIVADKDSDGNETLCVFRKEIPLGQTIFRQLFSQKREENIQKYKKSRIFSGSCLKKPFFDLKQLNRVERTCPFSRIAFEAKHDVLYTRKCFNKFEPTVYKAGGPVLNKTILGEFFSKVEQGVNSDCAGISREETPDVKDVLPDLIHLGRSEWYSFVFYLYLENEIQADTSLHSWSLEHLRASLHLSDATILNLTSRRSELVPQKAVRYEIWNSCLSCSTGYGRRGSIQGSYVMIVLLGCPAGRKIYFDPESSKNSSSKKHYCSAVHGVPCFYFYRDFLPVFKVLDLATGQVNQFDGKYYLKIVGGGPTYQSVTDYSQEEQIMYNYQTTSSMASLIWASKLKTLGDIPVFDSRTNGISWLCGTQSPCADFGPNFPGNAEYYFKLEFSNRIVDADSSNCDYTIRFLIRVHGLPPGSFNPSSVIVLGKAVVHKLHAVTQVRSCIGRPWWEKRTIKALGLGKLNQTVIQKNTTTINGTLRSVKHLLDIKPITIVNEESSREQRNGDEGLFLRQNGQFHLSKFQKFLEDNPNMEEFIKKRKKQQIWQRRRP
ncbi:Cation channel sperm-associated protein subunit gamma [Stylophora pistillata]|uniref:Large ribosomal subunit protein uL30m n=1 Tax=Stylophora pistillata TaxID=50429 RepID=A0A2B4S9C1_STYPI|nr:Cation channel sperm-associated protein subunit gamma [Stylophora pistillata]